MISPNLIYNKRYFLRPATANCFRRCSFFKYSFNGTCVILPFLENMALESSGKKKVFEAVYANFSSAERQDRPPAVRCETTAPLSLSPCVPVRSDGTETSARTTETETRTRRGLLRGDVRETEEEARGLFWRAAAT